jgi:histidine triad (HIT) family protein
MHLDVHDFEGGVMACLFCKIRDREIPGDFVHETERLFVLRDIQPVAPTHLLVIPRLHVATINDLTPEHTTLMGEMILMAQAMAAREGLTDSGYRLVMNCLAEAGQSVYHLHLHVLGGRVMRWPPG